MVWVVVLKFRKRTVVSEHRLKSRAIAFKNKILRARRKGRLPKLVRVRLIRK